MASEKDLELLENYLANRMNDQEKQAFEQKLEADPELKKELKFQQSLVEGIRQARVAELKAMLNNIPVTSLPGSQTALFTKVITSVVVVGLVSTAVYFMMKDSDKQAAVEQPEVAVLPEAVEVPEPLQQAEPEEKAEETTETGTNGEKPVAPEKKITEKQPASATDSRPKLDVYTPEEEDAVTQLEREQLAIIEDAFVTSSIEVETDASNKKYNFHYMFKSGKLILFGSFEENLYEILEFIAKDKRTVFLYYKSSYYLLDVTKNAPTELVAIRDQKLIRKLKEHRIE